LRLIEERGYAATKTEDIARAAGVSPRTFFNYFPTKESVVFFPKSFAANIVRTTLQSRPVGEDPAVSLAIAAMETFRVIAAVAGADGDGLLLSSLRVILGESACRPLLDARRTEAEEAAWTALIERGVSPEDLAARAAVTTVMALAWFALTRWVDGGGSEGLTALLARCLVGCPDPQRLAAGVVAATAPDPAG
jgi:AcrR family transcriptional regulator